MPSLFIYFFYLFSLINYKCVCVCTAARVTAFSLCFVILFSLFICNSSLVLLFLGNCFEVRTSNARPYSCLSSLGYSLHYYNSISFFIWQYFLTFPFYFQYHIKVILPNGLICGIMYVY